MQTAHSVMIDPTGPVAVATTAWRRRGRLRVTVLVKASFAFAPSGVVSLVDPTPLQRVEVHNGNNPMRSIRTSGELVPYLPRAEVLFVGSAHAPAGAPVASMPVRLAVIAGEGSPRPGEVLVDKRLIVHGERIAAQGAPAPDAKPFSRMPLVYENAFGGIGSPYNPLGTGFRPGADGRLRLPNVVDFNQSSPERPASFAPVSWGFPSRKRLLKGNRRALDDRIVELPDDFDDAFFHAAPDDQRFDALRGDERILLEHLHPVHARLELRLPGARALARAYDAYGQTTSVDLRADTLAIDGDAERVSLIWRGSFPFAREDALDSIRIAAGIELPSMPMAFPDPAVFRPAPRPSVAPPAPEKRPSTSETIALDDDDLIVSDEPLGGTMMLDDAPSPPTQRLPAGLAASRLPAPAAPLRPVSKHASTIGLSPSDHEAARTSKQALPFVKTAPSSAPRRPSAELPGAPWSHVKAAPVPKPKASGTLPLADANVSRALADAIAASDAALGLAIDDEGTVDLDSKAAASPAAEVKPNDAPPAPAAPPPKAAPVAAPGEARSKDPYGQVAPWASGASNAPAPAKPRPEPPKPSVRSKLYGKIGKK